MQILCKGRVAPKIAGQPGHQGGYTHVAGRFAYESQNRKTETKENGDTHGMVLVLVSRHCRQEDHRNDPTYISLPSSQKPNG